MMFGLGGMSLLGLLVVGAVVLMVWGMRGAGAPTAAGRDSAEEILKQRYARGEIDREEYLRRIEDVRR